jgi:hypothetical protein
MTPCDPLDDLDDLNDDQLDDLALIHLLGPEALLGLAFDGPAGGVAHRALTLADALAGLGAVCQETTGLLSQVHPYSPGWFPTGGE